MSYQPGDIVNGHVLGTDNQWHPLPPPPPRDAPAEATQVLPAADPTRSLPVPPPAPVGHPPAPTGHVPGGGYGPPPGGGYGSPPGGYPSGPGYPGPVPGRPPMARPPRRFYQRGWFWVLAVLGVVVAAGAIGLIALGGAVRQGLENVAKNIPTVTAPTARPTAARPTAPAPAPPTQATTPTAPGSGPAGAVGQAVKDGTWEFTVDAVDCSRKTLGKAPLTVSAQGSFCVVEVSLKNTGTAKASFMSIVQEAVSTQGTSLDLDGAGLFLDGAELVVDVPAGGTGRALLVFDSPDGGLREVLLRGDFLSDGVRVKVT